MTMSVLYWQSCIHFTLCWLFLSMTWQDMGSVKWVCDTWLPKWMRDWEGPTSLEHGKACWACWPSGFLPHWVHTWRTWILADMESSGKNHSPNSYLRLYHLQSVYIYNLISIAASVSQSFWEHINIKRWSDQRKRISLCHFRYDIINC